MLTFLKDKIVVFALFVLPQDNWSFDSGKTNGVMPANVLCHCHHSEGEYHGSMRFNFPARRNSFHLSRYSDGSALGISKSCPTTGFLHEAGASHWSVHGNLSSLAYTSHLRGYPPIRREYAEEHFVSIVRMYAAENKIALVVRESEVLRLKYPKVQVVPMIYRHEDDHLSLVNERT